MILLTQFNIFIVINADRASVYAADISQRLASTREKMLVTMLESCGETGKALSESN